MLFSEMKRLMKAQVEKVHERFDGIENTRDEQPTSVQEGQ